MGHHLIEFKEDQSNMAEGWSVAICLAREVVGVSNTAKLTQLKYIRNRLLRQLWDWSISVSSSTAATRATIFLSFLYWLQSLNRLQIDWFPALGAFQEFRLHIHKYYSLDNTRYLTFSWPNNLFKIMDVRNKTSCLLYKNIIFYSILFRVVKKKYCKSKKSYKMP